MAKKSKKGGGGNSGKDADFGRGTKKLPEKPYTAIFEGDAPQLGENTGDAEIVDKTA